MGFTDLHIFRRAVRHVTLAFVCKLEPGDAELWIPEEKLVWQRLAAVMAELRIIRKRLPASTTYLMAFLGFQAEDTLLPCLVSTIRRKRRNVTKVSIPSSLHDQQMLVH